MEPGDRIIAANLRASIALNKLEEARLRALLDTSPSSEVHAWIKADLATLEKRTEKIKAELDAIEHE